MSEDTAYTNDEIAAVLDRIAGLLEAQGANTHRVRAYRDGANSVRSAEKPVADYVRADDRPGLRSLPGIGEGLANVIFEYVLEGRSEVLERLRAEVSPVEILSQVPGLGEDLARRIVDELHIHTLEELEQAAHDGRLDRVEGFGERRVEQVRTSLAGMLSGAARRHAGRAADRAAREGQPSIDLLLDVDAEYRRRADAGDLPTIAPKRFNPNNESWLPILRTRREDWKFTALFSNTATAHELGKTRDWVVIYFDRGEGEDQVTVVTENDGALAGKRVVRGREAEAVNYYKEQS
jgi:hypothetical protein